MSTRRRISGRTVVISGAASGIGRALAQRLSAHGCPVALIDVDEVGPSLRYASAKVTKSERGGSGGGFGSQGGGQQAADPWATGGSAPASQQGGQGGWGGQQAAPQQPSAPQGGQQGGWAPAPSYDEPPF